MSLGNATDGEATYRHVVPDGSLLSGEETRITPWMKLWLDYVSRMFVTISLLRDVSWQESKKFVASGYNLRRIEGEKYVIKITLAQSHPPSVPKSLPLVGSFSYLNNLVSNKNKFTRAGFEPTISDLTCRRSTNWAILSPLLKSPYFVKITALGCLSEAIQPPTAR